MNQHYKQKHIYVGVDLHKATHTAVIVNCWYEKLGEIQFENKPAAFEELLTYVKKLCKRGMTPIYGLEDVGGYGRSLAVFLVENKQMVKIQHCPLLSARATQLCRKAIAGMQNVWRRYLSASSKFCPMRIRKISIGQSGNS